MTPISKSIKLDLKLSSLYTFWEYPRFIFTNVSLANRRRASHTYSESP